VPPTTTFNVLLILLPSVDLAVIIALPLALAVINPVLLTVATAALLDDQVSVLLAALRGLGVAVTCLVSPILLKLTKLSLS